MTISVRILLSSDDPLSETALSFLLGYEEEDENVDFKLTFAWEEEKSWLELTKDIASFANTTGGYLVFGVKNSDKDFVGLDDSTIAVLSDVNNIQQKVNRHLDPAVTALRAKVFVRDQKSAAVLYIPASNSRTHLISKDGEFKHPSGTSKLILRKGHIYIRRSGSNSIADTDDFEALFARRLESYRETLLSNIARVIDAPPNAEVFMLRRDENDPNGKRFIISDAPDSIPIQGLSFTVAPSTPTEEVAAWVAMSGGRPEVIPPERDLWNWYENREALTLTNEQKLAVAQFSVWRELPSFYWLQRLKGQDVQKTMLNALKHRPRGGMITPMFQVAAFLGKSVYNKYMNAGEKFREKLAPNMRNYPTEPRIAVCGDAAPPKGADLEVHSATMRAELNEIAKAGAGLSPHDQLGANRKARAMRIDCYLYAQSDRYA